MKTPITPVFPRSASSLRAAKTLRMNNKITSGIMTADSAMRCQALLGVRAPVFASLGVMRADTTQTNTVVTIQLHEHEVLEQAPPLEAIMLEGRCSLESN